VADEDVMEVAEVEAEVVVVIGEEEGVVTGVEVEVEVAGKPAKNSCVWPQNSPRLLSCLHHFAFIIYPPGLGFNYRFLD